MLGVFYKSTRVFNKTYLGSTNLLESSIKSTWVLQIYWGLIFNKTYLGSTNLLGSGL